MYPCLTILYGVALFSLITYDLKKTKSKEVYYHVNSSVFFVNEFVA